MYCYTAIDANGKPLQTISGKNEATVSGCSHPDEVHRIEGAPDRMEESYWDFSLAAWVVRAAQPEKHSIFDWTTKQWIDPRTLQDLKAAKWADIKRARDAAELGPFTYDAMEFDGDLNAQRRLAAYISISKSALAAGREFVAEFTLADDTQVTLSAQDFVGIELAKVQSVAAAFALASVLRGQIEAAQTLAELDAIHW